MKKILIIIFTFIFAFILINKFNKIDAVSSSIDSIAESYTNSDEFYCNGNQYSITDYKNSIEYFDINLFKSNVSYTDNGLTSNAIITGDDPIINLIPKELFTKVGKYMHVGLEYGFYIETAEVSKHNLISKVMLFDITYTFDRLQIKSSVTVLFQLEFAYLSNNENYFFRKKIADSNIYNLQTFYSLNNNSNYIVPLVDFVNKSMISDFYLKDISFASTISNIQELNYGDTNYDPYQDDGFYFTRMDYYYEGTYIQKGGFTGKDFLDILLEALEIGIGIVDKKGIIGITLSGLSIANIVMSSFSSKQIADSNKNFICNQEYNNRNDQIENRGFLNKAGYAIFDTNSDNSILYGTGQNAEAVFTLNHNTPSDNPINYTRLINEVGIEIADKNGDFITADTFSSEKVLGEPKEKELILEKETTFPLLEENANYFYFESKYDAKYVLNFSKDKNENLNDKIKVEINNEICILNENNITAIFQKNKRNKIVIINKTSDKILKEIKIMVSEDNNNIQINKNSSFLIKLSNQNGFKNIFSSNASTSIKVYNEILDYINPLKNNGTNHCSILLSSTNYYYVLIENPSDNTLSDISLIINNNFEPISVQKTINITIDIGDVFFTFIPDRSGEYIFAIINKKYASYDVACFTDFNKISFNTQIDYATDIISYRVNLEAGKRIYLGITKKTSGDLQFLLDLESTILSVYKNDKLIENNTLRLNQNEEFNLIIKINNEIILPKFVSSDFTIEYIGNYKWRVIKYAEIIKSKTIYIHSENNVLCGYINIIILNNFNISIAPFNDIPNSEKWERNRFSWSLDLNNNNYNDIICFKGEFRYDNGTLIEEFEFKESSNKGTIIAPNINLNSQNIFIKIVIIKVTYTQIRIRETGTYNSVFEFNNKYLGSVADSDKSFYKEPVSVNTLFSAGNGSFMSPFIIVSGWQLNNMRYMAEYVNYNGQNEYMITGHYLIANDIRTPDTHYFEPMPYLNGSLKGNGKPYISIGKLCTGSRYYGSGLFKSIYEGVVSNITIEIRNEEDRSGGFSVVKGVLAGYIIEGEVFNVTTRASFTTENVNGINSIIGGIAGIVSFSSLSNCESFVKIKTYGDAGGIAGNLSQGSINFCSYNGYIEYFYNAGSITNENNNKGIGGIVGLMYGSSSSIRGCSVYSSESSKILIAYKSSECNDTALKPCIGFIIGRKTNGSTSGNMIATNISINKGSLKKFKPSLFGSTYIQYDWVATGTNEAGRVG